jgi:hypothetical protein
LTTLNNKFPLTSAQTIAASGINGVLSFALDSTSKTRPLLVDTTGVLATFDASVLGVIQSLIELEGSPFDYGVSLLGKNPIGNTVGVACTNAGLVLTSDTGNLTQNTSAATNLALIQPDVLTTKNSVGTINTNIGTINTTTGGINTHVTTIDTNIAAINPNVNTINTNIGTINTTTGTINTATGTINTNIGTINTATGTINTNTSSIAAVTSTGTTPSRHLIIGAPLAATPSTSVALTSAAGGFLNTEDRYTPRFYDPTRVTTSRVLANNTLVTGTILLATAAANLVLHTMYIETLSNNVAWIQLFIGASAPINGAVPIFSFKCLGNATATYGADQLGVSGLSLGAITVGQSLFWGFSSTAATLTTSLNAKSFIIKIGNE